MTTTTRELDYRPLSAGTGARERLRAVTENTMVVVGATVAVLMVLVAVGVLAGLLATGNATDGGAIACLVLLLIGGLAGLWGVWFDAGKQGALIRFAKVNGLLATSGQLRPDYAGTPFANRSHAVAQSVRTPGHDFVEVGNRFKVSNVRSRDLRAGGARTPELFLRARLTGGAAHDPALGVQASPELLGRLEALAGPHTVEMTGTELTVLGSRALEVKDADQVRAAFALIDELVAQNARGVASGEVGEVDEAPAEPVRRRPVLVVLGVLAMLVVVPVAFALVMSLAEAAAGAGSAAVGVVAVLGIGALLAVTGTILRRLISPRRAATSRPDPG